LKPGLDAQVAVLLGASPPSEGAIVRLAYQGEPGAYSEAAARVFGGADAETLPCKSFDDVFEAVVQQRATHGVVPLENSIGGTIHRNYDLLLDHDLLITGEVELDVVHCLQALPGTKLAEVKVVYSHPQALAQCERYLKELGVTVEAVYDTAGGAKLVAEQKLAGAAALASRRAAEVFGLEVLQDAVQDFEFNITRFAIIGGTPSEDANKTTIVFALPSTPGALFKALSVFALRDINLSKLESRPLRGRPWEYLFYVEVDAKRDDLACARALTHLAEFARWTRVLGTYKGAERRTAG
jgi:prephenate dehydratase